MSESTDPPPGGGDERTPQEGSDLGAVVAERDALARQVQRLEDRPARRRRLRRISTGVLLVVTVLLFAVAVPGTWARRTFLDSDRYVAMVGPLAESPAVQDYLARTTAAAVFQALDVEQRLDSALATRAPRLAFLAGPISDAVRGFVEDKLRQVFASEAFSSYWTSANAFVHQQLVAALSGEGDTLRLSDGKVVLSLLPLVNQGLQAASTFVTQLIGRPIDLPEITGQEVPIQAVAKIEAVLGIDLPDSFGTVVVYDAHEIEAVQRSVDLAGRLMVLLILLVLLAFAGTLWASVHRRRTLIQLCSALAVVLVVERRFMIAAADRVVDRAKDVNAAAARAVVDRVLETFLRYTGWLLVIMVVTVVVALLTGPYPWAVRIRGALREVGSVATGTARGTERGSVPAWIAAHADAVMLGGAALAVVVLLLADLSIGGFLLVLGTLGVFEWFAYRLRGEAASD